MIERIERTIGAVSVDVWLCVCERETCGWCWIVPYSRGVPAACSKCKARNWNAGGGQVQAVKLDHIKDAGEAAVPVLDATGVIVPGLPASVRGKITTAAKLKPSTSPAPKRSRGFGLPSRPYQSKAKPQPEPSTGAQPARCPCGLTYHPNCPKR